MQPTLHHTALEPDWGRICYVSTEISSRITGYVSLQNIAWVLENTVGHVTSMGVLFKFLSILFHFPKILVIGHYIIHSFKTLFNEYCFYSLHVLCCLECSDSQVVWKLTYWSCEYMSRFLGRDKLSARCKDSPITGEHKTAQKIADSDWLLLLLSGDPKLDFRPKDWLFQFIVAVSGTSP
jgi:hypothetical protein